MSLQEKIRERQRQPAAKMHQFQPLGEGCIVCVSFGDTQAAYALDCWMSKKFATAR